MKNKKPWYHFYLKLLDYVSRFLTMFFITAITIIIFYFKFTPNARPLKDVQGIHYKGQTTGIITSAEAHTGMRQNRYGTRITTDYFLVTYTYQVNGITQTGSDQLNNTPVTAQPRFPANRPS